MGISGNWGGNNGDFWKLVRKNGDFWQQWQQWGFMASGEKKNGDIGQLGRKQWVFLATVEETMGISENCGGKHGDFWQLGRKQRGYLATWEEQIMVSGNWGGKNENYLLFS